MVPLNSFKLILRILSMDILPRQAGISPSRCKVSKTNSSKTVIAHIPSGKGEGPLRRLNALFKLSVTRFVRPAKPGRGGLKSFDANDKYDNRTRFAISDGIVPFNPALAVAVNSKCSRVVTLPISVDSVPSKLTNANSKTVSFLSLKMDFGMGVRRCPLSRIINSSRSLKAFRTLGRVPERLLEMKRRETMVSWQAFPPFP
mmetsp:Transcript_7459/g.21220  ORF Transcript_7459/g.21220 Transcript_7459/m.21220 type:complete len:201 (-) Transcript_7459:238-840(-)